MLLYCGRWGNATWSCGLFRTDCSGIDLQEKMDDIFRDGWDFWIVFICDISGTSLFISTQQSKDFSFTDCTHVDVIRGTSSFALVDAKYRLICAWCINSSHRLLLDAFSTTWLLVWSVLLHYFSGAIQNLIVDWQSAKEDTITVIGTMVLVGIRASLQRNLCAEFCFLRLFIILAAAHTIG